MSINCKQYGVQAGSGSVIMLAVFFGIHKEPLVKLVSISTSAKDTDLTVDYFPALYSSYFSNNIT